ncbi:hypothetical protein GCM10022377_20240 [Zhihengliuella alba]|uniref:ParB-like N-terminal domain-containing protein n=1 Tax=Zhihengliuella alba TaxID=547018 RepID=A0ABP7DLE1_9MICC
MTEKRRGLGRGLGALISSSPSNAQDSDDTAAPTQDSPTTASVATAGERTAPKKSPAPKATATKPAQKPTKAPQKAAEAGEAPLRAGSGAGTQSGPRKARPVDMFFTPGPAAEEAPSDAASPKKTSARSNGKRPAMPDVIGQARARSAASAPEAAGAAAPAEVEAVGADDSGASEETVSRETLVPVPGASFAEIPVVSIHPNRKQPRQVFDEEDMAELVHSIKEIGLLQPIVVRPSAEEGPERYELVMGERRWRATQEAGLETIPAIVRQTTNEDLLRDALLENLHRSQLNPLEEAAAYQQLLEEFGCTQEELSARIGRSRPQISNTIRLMKLPPLVQRRVAAGVLSQGHARALLALTDPAEVERLAQRIVAEGLSVRATEEIVAMSDGVEEKRKSSKPRTNARHERLDYLATSLSDRLDTNVKITLGAKKGKVAIEFASVDDLNRIMGLIAPEADQ